MREPGWCGPSDGSQRSLPDHGERPLQGRGDLGAETQAFGLGWQNEPYRLASGRVALAR